MIYEFRLPDIGEGVAEGEVVRWLVKEGDVLHEDQPMVEVMTDKATVEIPTPRAGRVVKRMFSEGQICPVGKVLIAIDVDAAPAPERAHAPATSAPAAPAVSQSNGNGVAATAAPASANGGGVAVLATPATRKLARDLGVDIGAVAGTGPAGRITSDDVRGFGQQASAAPAHRPAAASATDVRVPFRGLRKKIAENMVRSKQTAADVTYVEEVDCTDLVELRARANERLAGEGLKLSYLPFVIKATVAALQKYPQFNATLDEAAGEIVQRRQYHIGLATATESGLIVPVIRDADRRSVVELAREIDRLAALTRSGKTGREELTGSTFTISSLGQLGGVMATSIINQPEVAILGVHKIVKRPAVKDDKIVIRDLMNLSVSIDHRVLDGYDAARFVAEIKALLETPGLLYLQSV
jgi:pyruvate dehydrogenase E2 component (dihydrolipoamide acetyltransferase)